jgi:membrane protein implicated in regulation of membrane protease activity
VAKHETDVTSLVFGLLFLGLAALWALVELDVLSAPDASVAGPVVLVAAGAAGLLLTIRRAVAGRERPEQPVEQDEVVEAGDSTQG